MRFEKKTSSKLRAEPGKIFLIAGLTVGLALIILLPPMQVADEWSHFYRAYLLAEGRLFGDGLGGEVPQEIHRLTWETEGFMGTPARGPKDWQEVILFLKNMAKLRIVEKDQVYAPFSTVLYAPVPYAGMTAAIAIAKLCTDSPLFLMYFCRLGGLLMALALTYWAIKITPFGKWAFFLISMTPVIIFQRSGMSADGFINAFAMLYIAYVLRMAHGPAKTIVLKDILLLALLTIVMCLCKQAYLALPVLIWAIPATRYIKPSHRFAVRFGMPFLGWSAAAVWAFAVMRLNYSPVINGTDALGQLSYIMAHPFRYAAIMGSDLTVNAGKYLHELIGTLGWLDIPGSNMIVYVHGAVLLAISIADDNDKACPGKSTRVLAAVTMLLSIGLVLTLMYLWWAPVGSPSLPGMQGRYFTPLLALLPAIFCLPGRKGFIFSPAMQRWFKAAVFVWAAVLATDTLFRTVIHYYGLGSNLYGLLPKSFFVLGLSYLQAKHLTL